MRSCFDILCGFSAGLALLAWSAGVAPAAVGQPAELAQTGTARSAAQAPPQTASPAAVADTAEGVVMALYRHVTFETGNGVNWDRVKALFVPEAVVVLRTGRTTMSVFDLDGFVRDFVEFIKQAKLEERAFEETVVAIRTQEMGDIARAIVHYTARIPANGRPAQHGIDVFSLVKKDGSWRIVSIVNEIVRPEVPVPEELRR